MATLDGKQLKNGTVTAAKVASDVLVTDASRTLLATLAVGTGGDLTTRDVPTGATSVVNKNYVDAVAAGFDLKDSVAAATAAALPAYTRTGNVITADSAALPTIDGQTLAVGARLLVKDGAAGADNGIYVVTTATAPYVLTRSTDADSSAKVTSGMFCWVVAGTANGLKGFALVTPDPITLNTTSLSFSQVAQAAAAAWGSITGTLSNQTDLQTALDGKVDENAAITGATNTKITYDAKGLVTAGTAATTADIADSTNARYVTDAQLVVIGNTSGTNSGDQSLATGMRHLTALATTADFDSATATTMSATNTHGGEVAVFVNGQKQWVGSGNKTSDCYFSVDAGVTARTFATIASGDGLYWVGSVAGFELATSDRIDVLFMP